MYEPKMISITIEATEAVVLRDSHTGNTAGYCVACGASGWVRGYGYPYRARKVPTSQLKHKKSCPMNAVLKNDGTMRK